MRTDVDLKDLLLGVKNKEAVVLGSSENVEKTGILLEEAQNLKSTLSKAPVDVARLESELTSTELEMNNCVDEAVDQAVVALPRAPVKAHMQQSQFLETLVICFLDIADQLRIGCNSALLSQ